MIPRHLSRRMALTATAATLSLISGIPALAQEAASAEGATTREILTNAIGAEDAPVSVVEYASFTCPHCREFHMTVFPSLKAEYIDTGKVRFEMREVYFDRFGLWAAMIARCAPPDRYFGIVDVLFTTQANWARGDDPNAIVANLYAIGRQAALTDDEMEACLQDMGWAKALIADYQKNAEADDVKGTPTFVIDGKTHTNMPWEEFKALLDAGLDG